MAERNKIENQLVSVIIPCYNSSLTIRRSLQSVVEQSYTNLEIIIVDDASEDWSDCKSIIDAFDDSRIIISRHSVNLNGAAARNTGSKIATGNYLAFLDSDDEWSKNHIDKSLVEIISKNADFVYCKSLIKTSFPDLILPQRAIDMNEKVTTYLFTYGQAIYTPTFFIKKKVFDDILFDESLIRHQDFDFLLRLEEKKYTIVFSDHIGAVVHWENNDPNLKGESWAYSLEWLKKRRKYFNWKSASNFLALFVLQKQLKSSQYKQAFKTIVLNNVNPLILSKRNLYALYLGFKK